jgi:hypothetical protein
VAVCFIGGGNRSTRRKPLTCRKSLTDFIPKCCIEYTSPLTVFEPLHKDTCLYYTKTHVSITRRHMSLLLKDACLYYTKTQCNRDMCFRVIDTCVLKDSRFVVGLWCFTQFSKNISLIACF